MKLATYEKVSLRRKVICAFYFDQDGSFAGIKTYDIDSKMYESHTAAIAIDRLRQPLPDDMIMMADYELARLVGLRTLKSDQNSSNILSVQPIYFTQGKVLCDDVLQSLTPGMLDEIPTYMTTFIPEPSTDESKVLIDYQASSHMPMFAVVPIWCIFFAVSILLFVEVRNICRRSVKRWKTKRAEMAASSKKLALTSNLPSAK